MKNIKNLKHLLLLTLNLNIFGGEKEINVTQASILNNNKESNELLKKIDSLKNEIKNHKKTIHKREQDKIEKNEKEKQLKNLRDTLREMKTQLEYYEKKYLKLQGDSSVTKEQHVEVDYDMKQNQNLSEQDEKKINEIKEKIKELNLKIEEAEKDKKKMKSYF